MSNTTERVGYFTLSIVFFAGPGTERVGYFTLSIVFFAGPGTEREAKRRRWIRSDGEADGVLRFRRDVLRSGSSRFKFRILRTIDGRLRLVPIRLESSLKFRARVVSMTSLVMHSLLLGSTFYHGFPRGAGPKRLKPLYRSYKTIRCPLPPHSRL